MTEFAGELKLSEMIEALRVELSAAAELGRDQPLRFEVGPIEVEVEVAVTKTTTGSGGVEFWVVKAGAEREHANAVTHRIKVTLQPKQRDSDEPLEIAQPAAGKPPSFPPRR